MPSERITTSIPSLACADMFFKCLEVLPGDGTGATVDSISGARYDPAAGNPGDEGADIPIPPGVPVAGSYWQENRASISNAVYAECRGSIPVTGGNLPNFGSKSVILFGCGLVVDVAKVRIPVGNGDGLDAAGTAGIISVSFGGQMHGLVKSATDQLIPSTTSTADLHLQAASVGSFIGLIVEYVPKVGGTNGTYHARVIDINGDTLISDDLVTPLQQDIAVTVVGEVNPSLNNKTRFGGLAWHSRMAFSFDNGLPANRNDVYKWLMMHHQHGNRALPPQWLYL